MALITLAPVRLPPVTMPAPIMLPVALTIPPVNILPPVTFAVTFKLVPVAAPMLGVVSWALALTMILPVTSNAV